jgi:WhiB family transcriptional regulator, redox-sensing transcriptional regulator
MTAASLATFGLTDGPAWMDKHAPFAPCAQTDPELWFPEKGGSTREARRLCQRCPFLAACRAWALDHPAAASEGIWGGLSVRQRQQLRRTRGHAHATDLSVATREAA